MPRRISVFNFDEMLVLYYPSVVQADQPDLEMGLCRSSARCRFWSAPDELN
jgi:hypothetical protein